MALRPAFPSADEIATRYQEGVAASGDRWIQGMRNPRRDPKAAAVAASATYKAAMQKSLTEDAYAKGVAQIDPAEALATAERVGSSGYQAGAIARVPKMQKSMAKFVPHAQAAVTAVRNLPAVTDQDRENRAVAMIRGMREAGKKAAGR